MKKIILLVVMAVIAGCTSTTPPPSVGWNPQTGCITICHTNLAVPTAKMVE
jgi:uncharacterized membrane protein